MMLPISLSGDHARQRPKFQWIDCLSKYQQTSEIDWRLHLLVYQIPTKPILRKRNNGTILISIIQAQNLLSSVWVLL